MDELQQNTIMTRLEEERLRKKIMRRVYTRWFLTRKLPFVVAEVGTITFFVLMAQTRVSFLSVTKNAYIATSGPISFIRFFLGAISQTTPAVKMLAAILTVLTCMVIRDIVAARKLGRVYSE